MGKDAAFAALGLAEGAQSNEIRQAFRALSRVTHPDTGGDAVRFAAVVRAYRWLQHVGLVRDDTRRRAVSPAELRYRRLLVQPPEPRFTVPRPRQATVEPPTSSPTVRAATFDEILARELRRAS